jgi:topoisomerase IA-like protein
MPRELSKAEQEYALAHANDMELDALCADMPGIGVKTLEKFLKANTMPEEVPDESSEERQEKLQKATGLTAGKLMGRDPERGITVMTPGASELGDARRAHLASSNDKTARANNSRVHIMDPSKKAR